MVILKSKYEIEAIRKACQVVAECHRTIAPLIQPGITTNEIERIFEEMMLKHGAKPYQKGYKGYQYATCASTNDVIAHGFPSDKPLEEGDIVTIDTVAELDGWLGDSAWSYAVGQISPTAEKLMRVTKECLDLGIEQAQPGNRLGDVTSTIQRHAESHGFGVVRDLLAHGIGRDLHEQPTYYACRQAWQRPAYPGGHGIHDRTDDYRGNPSYDNRSGWLDRGRWTTSLPANTSIRLPLRLKVHRF